MRIVADRGVAHRFLWLKAVRAVNLSVHCFHALVGEPVRGLRTDAVDQLVRLPPARAYYLCGVSHPYRWERNSHLLAVPDTTMGARSVRTPGLSVTIEGLRVIPITDRCLDPELYGGREAYVTCRNLQGAAILAAEHGFRNEADRAPTLAARQAAQAGLSEG